MKTFFLHDGHLGDIWCYMNYILSSNKGQTVKCTSPNIDRVNFYKRVYDLLDTNTKVIFEVSDFYNISHGKKPYLTKTEYEETYKKYNQGNYIAYSFDANWIRDQKVPHNVMDIINHPHFSKIKKINCTLPMQIEEYVDVLSNCLFYVGVDNGVSHISKSVKCKSFLLEHKWPIENGFPSEYSSYEKCFGTEDAISKMKAYLDSLS